MDTIGRLSPDTRKWLILNVAVMAVATIVLWRGARGANGWITLCALARTMPLDTSVKDREKRLGRLLRNAHLEGPEMTPLLVRLALGDRPPPWVPVVVDQTTIRGVQVIMAGIRVARRIMPVAFACFTYETIRKSQNTIELGLLTLVKASLPPGCNPLYVMDRGYARVELFKDLEQMGHFTATSPTKKKNRVVAHSY